MNYQSSLLRLSSPQSEQELLQRAKMIAGLALGDIAKQLHIELPDKLTQNKGLIGQMIEACLGAKETSHAKPDFPHLGIELKTIPVNKEGRPQESTYVTTVPLKNLELCRWETSLVREKLHKVLWVPIQAEKTIPLANRRVGSPLLWQAHPEQEAILKADWEEAIEMIAIGKLSEITAHQGTYLQIRPKAMHAKALSPGIGEDGAPIQTLPRGFYLRPSFTAMILSEYYLLK